MKYLLKYWQKHKFMSSFIVISALLILYIISMVFVANNVNNRAENYYKPVRMTKECERIQVGGVFTDPDDESKIKSASFFNIENHSTYEQKVTFVIYQHNIQTHEDCFFDIDHIYIDNGTNVDEEIKDGIVTVPAGATLYIKLHATARDSSKALTSRSGPYIKIVILDN